MKLNSICVYCGSSDKVPQVYLDAATAMGQTLAERSIRLIYGGGSTGLMGRAADGALAAGGEVIGVIPESMMLPELAHGGLTSLEVVPDMHVRKARMAELADAFIALPGGLGTLEELFEALTWAQLGIHRKPVGLLNVHGYYEHLLAFLDHVTEEGFAYTRHRDLLHCQEDNARLIESLEAYEAPQDGGKWG